MNLNALPGSFLVVCLLSSAVLPALAQNNTAAPQLVYFTAARRHLVSTTLRLPGSVEPVRTSSVAASAAGLVTKLAVRDGQRVEAGTLLAEIDATPLKLRLQSAQAQYREAEARLKLTGQKSSRAEQLAGSGLISNEALDEAVSENRAWQARLETLAADMATIQEELRRTTVTAPFAGVVLKKQTETGQWLRVGDPVVDLMALDQLEVTVNVPESRIASMRVGTPARVTFASLGGREVRGKVSVIIPAADVESRTFPVKVSIAGFDAIGTGMTADVTFGENGTRAAMLVPKDAVVVQGDQKVVYVLESNNKVSVRTVRPLGGFGEWLEIDPVVKAGEQVIVRGNERLKPGQVVRGQVAEYELP